MNLIVIPARFGSSRFPGKPLAMIAGQTMLQRVCHVALTVAQDVPNTQALVATDDERILDHAKDIGIRAVMTPKDCPTGSDRILKAIDSLSEVPDAVVNLQGDTPLTPAFVLKEMLTALSDKRTSVVTPVVQLPWHELDRLRKDKQTAPFSGTTAIVNDQDEALWFSKQIIPALRQEVDLRSSDPLSPIYRHLGIYGYQTKALRAFASLPMGHYEQLEGLEQLRFLENGYKIKVIKLQADVLPLWRGVDTKADAQFIEDMLLEQQGQKR